MCGIAGFWHLRSGRPAEEARLRAMLDTLVHRGPDEAGVLVEGSLALGMRRLRVIDPEGGRQPMLNEDGRVRVVFNGEIYNHGALRSELEGLGHRFRSRSDTEVLVHGWEAWGEGLLVRLNGMFAFALHDARDQRLFLARDRFGIKPLYLAETEEGLVFGSELKAVVASGAVPLAWDLEAVDDFLTYEYVAPPRSIVRGVRQLLPAHRALAGPAGGGRLKLRRYWGLEGRGGGGVPSSWDEGSGGSAASLAGELRERLGEAVGARMEADVPLGAFLSGGVDSSSVVALMTERVREGGAAGPVRSYALGFGDPSWDERGWARLVADRLGTVHTEREVTAEVGEMAVRIAGHFDEPFGDVSAFPTLLLSGLAREGVTVALSGDGGDELFGGYDAYRAYRWGRRLRWLGGRAGWGVIERVIGMWRPPESKRGLLNTGQRFAEGMMRPEDLEHARWWVFQDLDGRRALYAGELAAGVAGRDPFAFYRERLEEGRERGFEGLGRQLYADLTGYLPGDILVKVDRMSMAVSLEARVPFLDHGFAGWAMGLPDEVRIRRGETKWILKEAMRELLPAGVLARRKEGFSMPMKVWLRGPLRPLMGDLLAGVYARGWFDGGEVRRLEEEHLAGRRNHAHRLWCLMSLELSLRGLERLPRWSASCNEDGA